MTSEIKESEPKELEESKEEVKKFDSNNAMLPTKEEYKTPELDSEIIEEYTNDLSSNKAYLQGLNGIMKVFELNQDDRKPDMYANQIMSIQVNQANEISKLFKEIGEREGLEELINLSKDFKELSITGDLTNYGLGIMKDAGVLDKYLQMSAEQEKITKAMLSKNSEQLSKDSLKLFHDMIQAKPFYAFTGFMNAEKLSPLQITYGILNNTTSNQFEELLNYLKASTKETAKGAKPNIMYQANANVPNASIKA